MTGKVYERWTPLQQGAAVAIVLIFLQMVAGLGGDGLLSVQTGIGGYQGTVVRLSYGGVLWPTWEGEFMTIDPQTHRPTNYRFSVFQNNPDKQDILHALHASLNEHIPVNIEYRQDRFVPPWIAATSYDITGVCGVQSASQ